MKFTWFNLMPWPYLPDDFRDKNRSVWVDIDQALFDPEKSHEVYNTYMDLLEYASTVGFDGIGVNEHHQNGYGIMPSPNIIAAGLARRTKDAALVVLGNSIALYNPPVRVAEEFAMLDCISGGRLVAGFPVGTSMDTNFCYGQIPSLTREKYQEAHDLIIKACDRCFADDNMTFDQVVSCLEANLLRQALRQSGGNRSQAAKLLSLSPSTLRDKLKKYNLDEHSSAGNS